MVGCGATTPMGRCGSPIRSCIGRERAAPVYRGRPAIRGPQTGPHVRLTASYASGCGPDRRTQHQRAIAALMDEH